MQFYIPMIEKKNVQKRPKATSGTARYPKIKHNMRKFQSMSSLDLRQRHKNKLG